MWVHEYQAKELLRQNGVPVINGIAVFTVQEAVEAAQKLGGGVWRLKAQTHTKKENEQGRFVHSLDELKQQVSRFLNELLVEPNHQRQERKIRRLLVEECVDVEDGYGFSISIDCSARKLQVCLKPFNGEREGGAQIHVDSLKGLGSEDARQLVVDAGVASDQVAQVAAICEKLYAIYEATDAILLNLRLAWVKQRGRVEVIDARICFDDGALFRQPDIHVLRDLDEENPNALEASLYDIVYMDLKGRIGCLSNGGGLTIALLDMVKSMGGEPANCVNVEGALTEEKMLAAFEIMHKNDEMCVLLIHLVVEVLSCDVVARHIVGAYEGANLNIPLVVRLKGCLEDEGEKMLKACGLPVHLTDSLEKAVQRAVALGNE